MTLNEWIIFGQTGISSETMWAAITGAASGGSKDKEFNTPQDPADFYRCLSFVEQCNISFEQMQQVKAVFPWFAPFIDNWDKMLALWNEESASGECQKLFDLMQELEEESMLLGGYVKVGKNSWQRTS